MKDTIFRGINKDYFDKGKIIWHYGNLIICNNGDCAIETKASRKKYGYSGISSQVDPATVGQYTYRTDIHNNKSFGADVIKYKDFSDQIIIGVIRFGEYDQDGSRGEYTPVRCTGFFVERLKTIAPEYLDVEDAYAPSYMAFQSINQIGDFEIIGNIYDNPELLERSGLTD